MVKALSKMPKKELAKEAKKYEVEITKDMDREDVEQAISEAKDNADPADLPAEPESPEGKKQDRIPKGKALVRNMLPKGSVKIGKMKWLGLKQKVVSVAEAENLVQRFPARFKIIRRG